MSKWLITGDWQASSRNLGTIEQCAEREREIMAQYGCTDLIDLGDLKEPYNPMDARLALVMRDRLADKSGIVLLGNHDRLSQNTSESWLPLLDKDHMQFVSKPRLLEYPHVTFFLLPYNGNIDELRESVAWLADEARRTKHGDKVLLFHCDIMQADYGHGHTLTNVLSVADMQFDAYDYAFGGHVHKPQDIVLTQAWYVGSPFCQDWGEANQQKRFLVYEPLVGVKSVPVGLPGLYDWDTAKGMKPEDLKGSTVRLRVPAKDATHFKALAKKRQTQFSVKYPDAILHCVPEYEETEVADYTFVQGNDQVKVTEYIKQKHNGDQKLTDYVISKLEQATSVKSLNTEGIRFLWAKGHNYTSFEDVRMDYRKQGVVLINGKNKDWPGRSNGSGKTNLMDLIKVTMFGQTGKEQTADAWASETLGGFAWVQLAFRNAQGQKIEIERTRKPAGLSVKVDGEDKSSGLTGREKLGGTQAKISELSGYDLRMLTNAVYIDQERAHNFLTGTPKDKSELLYKFQGLERFETARALVAAEVKTNKETLTRHERDQTKYTTECETLQRELIRVEETEAALVQERTACQSELTQAQQAVKELVADYKQAVANRDTLDGHIKNSRAQLESLLQQRGVVEGRAAAIKAQRANRSAALATAKERVAQAQKVVDGMTDYSDRLDGVQSARDRAASDLDTANIKAAEIRAGIATLKKQRDSLGSGKCDACGREYDNARLLKTKLAAIERDIETAGQMLVALHVDRLTSSYQQAQEAETRMTEAMATYRKAQDLLQSRTEQLAELESADQGDAEMESVDMDQLDNSIQGTRNLITSDELVRDTYTETIAAYTDAYNTREQAQKRHADLAQRDATTADWGKRVRGDIDAATGLLRAATEGYKAATEQARLHNDATACLDRWGIPAYLCGMLCPTLTKAAAHYAGLFSDDAMQVVFEFTKDGEFDCRVINGQGSNTVEGLSTGEKATAALITAFALRSAAPKTNVLILDEPGRGLDEQGQQQFAKAVRALSEEFETVLITTHEKAMEAMLEGSKTLTVVKENRVSKIL